MNKTIVEVPKLQTVKLKDLPKRSFFIYLERENTFGNKKLFLKLNNESHDLNCMWMDENHGELCHLNLDLNVIEMQVTINAKIME